MKMLEKKTRTARTFLHAWFAKKLKSTCGRFILSGSPGYICASHDVRPFFVVQQTVCWNAYERDCVKWSLCEGYHGIKRSQRLFVQKAFVDLNEVALALSVTSVNWVWVIIAFRNMYENVELGNRDFEEAVEGHSWNF